jgi:hypothetical protein
VTTNDKCRIIVERLLRYAGDQEKEGLVIGFGPDMITGPSLTVFFGTEGDHTHIAARSFNDFVDHLMLTIPASD